MDGENEMALNPVYLDHNQDRDDIPALGDLVHEPTKPAPCDGDCRSEHEHLMHMARQIRENEERVRRGQ